VRDSNRDGVSLSWKLFIKSDRINSALRYSNFGLLYLAFRKQDKFREAIRKYNKLVNTKNINTF